MADVVNRGELAAHFERIETVIDHTQQLADRVESLLEQVAALGARLEAVDRLHGHQLAEIVDALHCPPEAGGGKAAAVVEAVSRMETLLKDIRDALSSADRVPEVQVEEPVGETPPSGIPAGLPPPWGAYLADHHAAAAG